MRSSLRLTSGSDACDYVSCGGPRERHGRIISLLEGGYDTEKTNGLGKSVEKHLKALVERSGCKALYPALDACVCCFAHKSPGQLVERPTKRRLVPWYQAHRGGQPRSRCPNTRGRGVRLGEHLTLFVGVATTALAGQLGLPTLGTSPLLAGEAKAVQRGKSALKPDANVRLLALHGVGTSHVAADVGLKGAGVVRDAAARIAGPRLPRRRIAAAVRRGATRRCLLRSSRSSARWVASPQTRWRAARPAVRLLRLLPGALLLYELCLELDRRGAPPPLALVASGCGAPHAVSFFPAGSPTCRATVTSRCWSTSTTAFG